jgi:cephalosporin-C deacetylase
MLQLCKYSLLYYKSIATLLLFCGCVNISKAQKPLKFSAPSTSVVATPINNYYGFAKDNTSINATIKTFEKDGIFDKKSKTIGYALRLVNKLKEEQVGNIKMQISNNTGSVLYKEVVPFTIKKRGSFQRDYVFAQGQLQPGFYISSMDISTNRYADTISYNFGYEPSKIVSKMTPPPDFINFWDNAKKELNSTPANYLITPRPDLATKNSDAYEVEYKSIDKATIYGWLTVPKTSRTKPVLYKISDYQSELSPEFRDGVAVLCINTRGTGSSNQNYSFAYDQLGVNNLKDKNKYYLKGVYMDALRGLDLISQFSGTMKLNANKIVASGNGLGGSAAAVIAAIDPRLKGAIVEGPSFIGMKDMINFGEGMTDITFPASMFKNYYNSQKISRETVIKTLEYFDPVYFAPYISCPVLTGFSLHNKNVPAQSVYNFISQLRTAKKDKYECKSCENSLDKGFYGFKEIWLKERFGQP